MTNKTTDNNFEHYDDLELEPLHILLFNNLSEENQNKALEYMELLLLKQQQGK